MLSKTVLRQYLIAGSWIFEISLLAQILDHACHEIWPWRNRNRLKKLLCRSWNFAISLLVQTLDTHATWIVVICFSEMEALMHLAKKLFNAQNVPSITQLAIKSRDTCMLWAYSILSCSFFIRSLTYSKNIKFSFHKWIQNNSSSKFSYYQATRKINC